MKGRCDAIDLLVLVLAVLFYFWIEWWGRGSGILDRNNYYSNYPAIKSK